MSSTETSSFPATLASLVLSFFASHLVILSLLVFLAVGTRLAGVWGGQATPAVAEYRSGGDERQPREAAVRESTTQPTVPDVAGPGPVQSTQQQTGEGHPEPPAAAPDVSPPHKAPRMIGGALPIYGAEEPRARAPDDPGEPGDGGFRPGGILPGGGSAPVASREEMIQQARRAFWNGDFEGAETGYMEVLTYYPADADIFGELGNLYQSMGKPQLALDAYYEAGLRLKTLGDAEKLSKIIDLLQKSDDPRAATLAP